MEERTRQVRAKPYYIYCVSSVKTLSQVKSTVSYWLP